MIFDICIWFKLICIFIHIVVANDSFFIPFIPKECFAIYCYARIVPQNSVCMFYCEDFLKVFYYCFIKRWDWQFTRLYFAIENKVPTSIFIDAFFENRIPFWVRKTNFKPRQQKSSHIPHESLQLRSDAIQHVHQRLGFPAAVSRRQSQRVDGVSHIPGAILCNWTLSSCRLKAARAGSCAGATPEIGHRERWDGTELWYVNLYRINSHKYLHAKTSKLAHVNKKSNTKNSIFSVKDR